MYLLVEWKQHFHKFISHFPMNFETAFLPSITSTGTEVEGKKIKSTKSRYGSTLQERAHQHRVNFTKVAGVRRGDFISTGRDKSERRA